MLRKVPHKRKIKNYSKQICIGVIIFIATFSLLSLLYAAILFATNKLESPLALIKKTFHNTTSAPDTQKIQNLLEKNSIPFSGITATQQNTTLVTLKDGQKVILSNTKGLEQQIASLQLIMRQLTIEGKRFNQIDFRFDNPVVTY